jgi:hypothetical protein
MTKFIICFLFWLISFQLSYCQSVFFGFEYQRNIGALIAHSPVMKHLPNELITANQYSIFLSSVSSKKWHLAYSKPDIGLTYYSGNLGNKYILGKTNALYSFLRFPVKTKENFKISCLLGVGMGYVTKVYDPENNTKNTAVSSHWNCIATIGLTGRYSFNKIGVLFGVSAVHLSNAAFKSPNLGLNMPELSVGLFKIFSKNRYNIPLVPKEGNTETNISYERKYLFMYSMGGKQMTNYRGYTFPIYSVKFFIQKQKNNLLGIEYGIDIMQNTSDVVLVQDKSYFSGKIWKAGIFTGLFFPLDRLSLFSSLGIYVYDKFNLNGRFYNRFGMRYTIAKKMFVNLSIKTHWANADYAEFGAGIRF